jgi:ribonuclease D
LTFEQNQALAFELIVEEIIRGAMERGEFKDLAGKGKPIDLTAYFQAPEDAWVAQTLLKNAGITPREVELLQEIWDFRQREATTQDPESRRVLRRQIASRQLELDLRTERYRRRSNAR